MDVCPSSFETSFSGMTRAASTKGTLAVFPVANNSGQILDDSRMYLGNSIRYTVVYSYRCECGASNMGSMQIEAQSEAAALRRAYAKPLVCHSCGSASARENLHAFVQMLSF
jgi:hypothetical protein